MKIAKNIIARHIAEKHKYSNKYCRKEIYCNKYCKKTKILHYVLRKVKCSAIFIASKL